MKKFQFEFWREIKKWHWNVFIVIAGQNHNPIKKLLLQYYFQMLFSEPIFYERIRVSDGFFFLNALFCLVNGQLAQKKLNSTLKDLFGIGFLICG